MTTDDEPRFIQALQRLLRPWYEPHAVDDALIELWLDALADLPIEAFETAVGIYHRTRRYKPTPADIRDILGANASLWPEPDEAWNLTPKSEAESGWLCDEMAAALAACTDSLQRGDLFSARRAFIEVYTRKTKQAELAGRAPRWWISEASCVSYEARLQQRQALLDRHPQRRPDLIAPTQRALQALSGSARTGGGLNRLSAPSSMPSPSADSALPHVQSQQKTARSEER